MLEFNLLDYHCENIFDYNKGIFKRTLEYVPNRLVITKHGNLTYMDNVTNEVIGPDKTIDKIINMPGCELKFDPDLENDSLVICTDEVNNFSFKTNINSNEFGEILKSVCLTFGKALFKYNLSFSRDIYDPNYISEPKLLVKEIGHYTLNAALRTTEWFDRNHKICLDTNNRPYKPGCLYRMESEFETVMRNKTSKFDSHHGYRSEYYFVGYFKINNIKVNLKTENEIIDVIDTHERKHFMSSLDDIYRNIGNIKKKINDGYELEVENFSNENEVKAVFIHRDSIFSLVSRSSTTVKLLSIVVDPLLSPFDPSICNTTTLDKDSYLEFIIKEYLINSPFFSSTKLELDSDALPKIKFRYTYNKPNYAIGEPREYSTWTYGIEPLLKSLFNLYEG